MSSRADIMQSLLLDNDWSKLNICIFVYIKISIPYSDWLLDRSEWFMNVYLIVYSKYLLVIVPIEHFFTYYSRVVSRLSFRRDEYFRLYFSSLFYINFIKVVFVLKLF